MPSGNNNSVCQMKSRGFATIQVSSMVRSLLMHHGQACLVNQLRIQTGKGTCKPQLVAVPPGTNIEYDVIQTNTRMRKNWIVSS